jgi:hypothetical protein
MNSLVTHMWVYNNNLGGVYFLISEFRVSTKLHRELLMLVLSIVHNSLGLTFRKKKKKISLGLPKSPQKN